MKDYSLLATMIGYLEHSSCISSNMVQHSASFPLQASLSPHTHDPFELSLVPVPSSSFSFSSDCFSYFISSISTAVLTYSFSSGSQYSYLFIDTKFHNYASVGRAKEAYGSRRVCL